MPRMPLVGALLVIASALTFSAAGVLTKSISADAWTVACWRGLVGGLIVSAYVAWRGRGRPIREIFSLRREVWIIAAVSAGSSLLFIAAFKMTFVANVTVIYALAPFLAAGMAWFTIREPVRGGTLLAAALSLGGVVLLVGGGLGAGRLAGDLVALAMTAGNALFIVLMRTYRDVPTVWAGGGLAALMLFAIAWSFTDPIAVSEADLPLLVLFGIAFAVAVILWTEGTRFISAAESGFFGTAEIPFAVLLAWIFLSELPAPSGMFGGGIVLIAVIGHAVWQIRGSERGNT